MASGQQIIWNQALKVPLIRNYSRAYSSFRQRSREPYILPRLVIDLDSADNKYVRQAEDGVGIAQDDAKSRQGESGGVKRDRPGTRSKIATSRKRGETAKHQQSNDEDEQRGFRRLAIGRLDNNGRFRTSTTAPLDILTYALNGNKASTDGVLNDLSGALKDLSEELNIHSSDTAESSIAQLLDGLPVDGSDSISATTAGLEDKTIWAEIGSTFVPFAKLHREISTLCSTANGSMFLLENGSLLVKALDFCYRPEPCTENADEITRVMNIRILSLLNSIYINMKSKGLEIGPALCNAGIYYSSAAFNLESLTIYLQLMVKNGYQITAHAPWALSQVLRQVRPAELSHAGSSHPAVDIQPSRTVLSLLTGAELDGPICPLEQRNPSFASLLHRKQPKDFASKLYHIYLITLGKIGARQHLLHEYDTAKDSHLQRPLHGDENSVLTAQLFAVSFVLAGDIENAATTLKNGLFPAHRGGEENDLRPIISNLYRAHNIEIAANFDRKLQSIVANDPESTLDVIQRLINHDALSAVEETIKRRIVVWAENGDGTGQAVANTNTVEQTIQNRGGIGEIDSSM